MAAWDVQRERCAMSSSTFSGVTFDRKSMYSSVWKRVMVSADARFARYNGVSS